MKAEFDIKVTQKNMYHFMMYHSYHGFSGIFSIVAGILLLVCYGWQRQIGGENSWLYLLFGVLFLVYQPWSLFLGAARQVTQNPVFRNPLHYELDDEGITVRQGESADTISWANVKKVCETSQNILVYTSSKNAFIWAKKQLGDQETTVRELLAAHAPSKGKK